ncbi:MAG: hypothetical protein D6753_03350 [Planctomycetota bacterium]|nr:MAG: hypothetical protein D6753_03350 [Planctomycetota bacterium]
MMVGGVRNRILALAWVCAAMFGLTQVPVAAQYEETPLEQVLEIASSGDRDERRDAAYEIVRRESFDAPVVETLAKLTADSDRQVRFLGLLGLAHAGPRAASQTAIDALLRCIQDGDDQVRFRAADALGKIGTLALPQLVALWDSADSQTRVEIARAIGTMGPPARGAQELLSKGLEDSDERIRRSAANALLAVAPQDDALHRALTEHADPQIRCLGWQAIGRHSAPGSDALERLAGATDDPDPLVREVVVMSVAKSALDPQRKQQAILATLTDPVPSVRSAAVAAIEHAGADPQRLSIDIGNLLAQVEDVQTAQTLLLALRRMPAPPSMEAASMVLAAAGRLSLPAEEVAPVLQRVGPSIVPHLLAVLEETPSLEPVVGATLSGFGAAARDAVMQCTSHPSAVVRQAACAALQSLPSTAETGVALQRLLTDADDGVRAKAIEVVGQMQHVPSEVQAQVAEAPNDPSPRVRAASIRALPRLGLEAGRIESILRNAIVDEEPLVRLAGIEVAGQTGLVASLVDDLPTLIRDPDPQVRVAALHAVAGMPAEKLIPPLRQAILQCIGDRHDAVRAAGIEVASALHMRDGETVAALIDSLRGPESVLVAVLRALEGIGREAQAALPAIAELLHHDSPTVRTAAIAALAGIDKDTPRLVARLIEALDDPAWEVRQAAGARLGTLGPQAKAAVPKLFELLASEEDSDFASGALREIDAAPKEALQMFVQNLDSPDRRTAYFSIFFLGKLGADAKSALPELKTRLKEAEGGPNRSDVRARFLRQAIESIEGSTDDSP